MIKHEQIESNLGFKFYWKSYQMRTSLYNIMNCYIGIGIWSTAQSYLTPNIINLVDYFLYE